MAVLSRDRIIRIFNFLSGKVQKKIDETLDAYSAIQQVNRLYKVYLIPNKIYIMRWLKASQQLGNMEFGRRLAIEKDIDRNEANFFSNLGRVQFLLW